MTMMYLKDFLKVIEGQWVI